MENQNKELYIPVKTMDSDDYISGIGKNEVIMIFICLVTLTALGIMCVVLTGNMVSTVFTLCFIMALAIMLIRRDSNNENMFKKIHIVFSFLKSSQRYIYSYFNIYEKEK